MKLLCQATSAIVVAAAWLATPANAEIIIYSTQLGLLLSDNFETSTVGDPPANPPWNLQNGTPLVGNSTTFGITGNSGTNFVQLNSGTVQPGDAIGLNFGATPVTSGSLSLSFAFFMPTNASTSDSSRFRVDWFESSALTNLKGQIGFVATSSTSTTGTVAGTSLSFNKGEWTNVTLTVNVSSTSTTNALTVTVNGSSEQANMLNTNPIYGLRIISRASGGPTVYIDGIVAVPEPSSLALSAAGLGGLLLLRRHRRSRRWKHPGSPGLAAPPRSGQVEIWEADHQRL